VPRTHVDLFTGLGGFSLAARASGIETICMCEKDPSIVWPLAARLIAGMKEAEETRCPH